jgi:hypothetical protein
MFGRKNVDLGEKTYFDIVAFADGGCTFCTM